MHLPLGTCAALACLMNSLRWGMFLLLQLPVYWERQLLHRLVEAHTFPVCT